MAALSWFGLALASHQARVGEENQKKQEEDIADAERKRKKDEAAQKQKQLRVERGMATGGYQSTLGAGSQALGTV